MNRLADGVLKRDIRALSRALSIVEDRRASSLELLKTLYPRAGHARVIGVTGSPGAGKSTLVNALIGRFRAEGLRVAVVAVDPSSAFSGGALLGDRVRMQDKALDPGVFIRSMATRGHMGGLAQASDDLITVLDAAGYDVILVETVGVGQDEVDIVKEADSVIVVLVPGLGDDIQAIKAGIMEIADVFVINKADREGVERLEREILAMLDLAAQAPSWRPPVIRTVATREEGVNELFSALSSHKDFISTAGVLAQRRREKQRQRFWSLLEEGFRREVRKRRLSLEREENLVQAFERRDDDPYSAAEELLSSFCGDGDPRGEGWKIGHVGVAVSDMEAASRFYEDAGLMRAEDEVVEEQKARVTFFPVGESRIELLESTDPSGPVGKFIAKKGPGLHHICIQVPDIEAALARLSSKGYDLIDRHPRPGAGGTRVAFIHPRATGGVLLELCEAAGHSR